jgi:hypothetical protein
MASRLAVAGSPLASAQVDFSAGRVRWWAFRETSGASPAVLRFWDGSAAGSQLLMPISLAGGESTRDFVGHDLIPYYVGLFMEVVSGTVEGAMMVSELPGWHPDATPVVIIGSVNVTEGA